MHSRKAVMEAKEAAKAFIKAVDAWEKEYPKKKPSEVFQAGLTDTQISNIMNYHGFGNRHSGEIKATSLILTRRLADLRR